MRFGCGDEYCELTSDGVKSSVRNSNRVGSTVSLSDAMSSLDDSC